MVEDYTTAFLVSFGVVIFLTLFTVYALWGMLTAMGIGLVADRVIGKPGRR